MSRATWQSDLLVALENALPEAEIAPYGSVTDPALLDGWSDLDVSLTAREPVDLERVLQGRLWAFRSSADGEVQVVRTVLDDGRRVDVTLRGALALLPPAPDDNDVRFDAALAAVRCGRGNHLIGLHLVLGILREALVHRMVAADQAGGTTRHRFATSFDADAAAASALFAAPLSPEATLEVYALYGAWRAAVQPGYEADDRGLRAVIARGTAGAASH